MGVPCFFFCFFGRLAVSLHLEKLYNGNMEKVYYYIAEVGWGK